MLFIEHEGAFVEHQHYVGGAFALDGRSRLQQLGCRGREGRAFPGLGGTGDRVPGDCAKGEDYSAAMAEHSGPSILRLYGRILGRSRGQIATGSRLVIVSRAMSTSDATELAQLRDALRQFAGERDWDQFHSPKNLASALAVEAAELLERFQWLTEDESRNLPPAELARRCARKWPTCSITSCGSPTSST